jgi:hypothetical protein
MPGGTKLRRGANSAVSIADMRKKPSKPMKIHVIPLIFRFLAHSFRELSTTGLLERP